MRGIGLCLDIENEWLADEVKRLISCIDYPLRFERICVSESCRAEFLKGDVKKDLEVSINPNNPLLNNRRIFRGYFARLVFLLINEKEGLHSEIHEAVNCPLAEPLVKNFFADFKAAKYGFSKVMKQFFTEKITEKMYSKAPVTKREFVEYYTYYLVFKKLKEGDDLGALIMPLKPVGIDPLLKELEKLDYPFKLGDRNLAKVWKEVLGGEDVGDGELK
ncbi:MAG: hypothetical protein ACP5E4_04305 [Candidatus Aenigmatarchaeota archaeon]